MLTSFDDMERALLKQGSRARVALAGADDDLALDALLRACRSGVAEAVLIGDVDAIGQMLKDRGENPAEFKIVPAASEMQAARAAVKLVVDGEADLPMKGRLQTATYLMAVRFGGLVDPGALVSEFTAFHFSDQGRIIVFGDSAVNIAPTLDEKRSICSSLIGVARALGASPIKVACLSLIEKPDPTVPSSVEAQELAQMDWGEDVLVEGPFALDNALDADAAAHKGICSAVAGHADVLLVPDAQAGNILHKCAHFFGHYPFASGLAGARVPVIMNSRTDDADAKYYSILVAATQLATARAKGGA